MLVKALQVMAYDGPQLHSNMEDMRLCGKRLVKQHRTKRKFLLWIILVYLLQKLIQVQRMLETM